MKTNERINETVVEAARRIAEDIGEQIELLKRRVIPESLVRTMTGAWNSQAAFYRIAAKGGMAASEVRSGLPTGAPKGKRSGPVVARA